MSNLALSEIARSSSGDYGVDKSLALLTHLATGLVDFSRVLTHWCPTSPELEAKLLFGRLSYFFNLRAHSLVVRCSELGLDIDPTRPPNESIPCGLLNLAELRTTEQRLGSLHGGVLPALLLFANEIASSLHPVWDEPSQRVLRGVTDEISAAKGLCVDTISQLRTAFVSFEPDNVTSPFQMDRSVEERKQFLRIISEMPSSPGRDSRFVISDEIPVRPKDGSLSDWVIADMHITLTSVEIPTIEACARNICEFPEMPFDFILDMSRQIWDEVRHATACRDRLKDLGGFIGQYPCDFKLWVIANNQPLHMRLAVHQRIGEWLGVDAALAGAAWIAEKGDEVTAKLYGFIARDEISHVSIGNRWIRNLVHTDEAVAALHQQALELRTFFGEAVDGEIKVPIHRWACERAGFSTAEIGVLTKTKRRSII